MFSQACVKNSVHRGEVSTSWSGGRTLPPPKADTDPTPQTATAADGMYPTGMHPCYSSHHKNSFTFRFQWTIKTLISSFPDGIEYKETNLHCLLTVATELVAAGNSIKQQHIVIVINLTHFSNGKKTLRKRELRFMSRFQVSEFNIILMLLWISLKQG